MEQSKIYDVAGIGFGPSNIALAVAMHDKGYSGSRVFLEDNPGASWQHGMMLNGSDIQHNPLRDFSTPVNPQGRFTFTNYLHVSNKFFSYLNVGLTYAYRTEFAAYVDWVKSHFDHEVVGDAAVSIEAKEYAEPLWEVVARSGASYRARKLVVGTGRAIRMPDVPGLADCPAAIHLTRYLYHVDQVSKDDPIVVVGASQSAAEIVLDLLCRGFGNVHLVHRSFSLQLKDTSPFSDEVYFPEFVDYYHGLDAGSRRMLSNELRRSNYSSVDRDVLDQIYRLAYEEGLAGCRRLTIHRNHEVAKVESEGGAHRLFIRERYKGDVTELNFGLAILATGFLDIGRDGLSAMPAVLRQIAGDFLWHGNDLEVARDYQVSFEHSVGERAPVYLNGLCEATHGMGDAGSFSLLSLRARDILHSIQQQESDCAAETELTGAA